MVYKFSSNIIKLILLVLLSTTYAFSDSNSFFKGNEGNEYVTPRIIFSHKELNLKGDDSIYLGILFKIEPGWHIYWENPGESGLATNISLSLPDGWTMEELSWPIPKRTLERGDLTTFAYSEEVLIYTKLTPPSDKSYSDTNGFLFESQISWLVCYDRCIPGNASLKELLKYSENKNTVSESNKILFSKYKALTPIKVDSIKDFQSKSGISLYKNISNDNSQIFFHIPDGEPLKAQFFEYENFKLLKQPSILDSNDENLVLKLDSSSKNINLSGVLAFKNTNEKLSSFKIEGIPFSEIKSLDKSYKSPYTEGQFETSDFLTSTYKDNVAKSDSFIDLTSKQNFTDTNLIIALLFAFIGGIILNFMPCVLPILSIKLMGIVSAREKTSKHNFKDASWFTLGIIASFLLLAIVATGLKASGHALGWGFQFQYPGFIFALIIILFVLSLGFFDLYIAELPFLSSLTKLSGKDPLKHDRGKHFFDGVLISALSTPCTAPFLGTALAFAFSQTTLALFLIFIFIGLGLAFPFFLVVTRPKLLNYFPKPGTWMNRIKHLMGFALLATIIWLLKVIESINKGSAIQTLLLLLSIYLLFWFWSWSKESKTKISRYLILITGLLLPLLSFIYANPLHKKELNRGEIEWIAYDEDLLNTNKPIFIDFTAEWCITCKYNENLILSKNSIVSELKKLDFVTLKADWTDGSDKITSALERFGGNGVPHYVIIPPDDRDPVVLSTILTEKMVLEALKEVTPQNSE